MQLIEKENTIEKNVKDTNKNQRILKIDIIRTFAILCVILCHTCEAMYNMINTESDYLIVSLLHTLSRLGVPLFLFISGALLLKKNIDSDEDIIIFYKKNLLPLILVNSIWIIIYNIFFILSGKAENVTINNLIKELFFLKQVPVPNMWYFPMIIGTYLGIPFIAKIVKTFSAKTIKFILLFLLISNYIIPNVNVILIILGINEYLQLFLNLNFLGGTYGVYIILGYYMYNNQKGDTRWIILLTIGSFLIACCKRFLLRDIWYNSLSLLICGSALFILFNRIKEQNISEKVKKICTYFSKISLSLFFIHYIIQTIIYKYIQTITMPIYSRIIILYIGVVLFSTLAIKILGNCKMISKYVLRIK